MTEPPHIQVAQSDHRPRQKISRANHTEPPHDMSGLGGPAIAGGTRSKSVPGPGRARLTASTAA